MRTNREKQFPSNQGRGMWRFERRFRYLGERMPGVSRNPARAACPLHVGALLLLAGGFAYGQSTFRIASGMATVDGYLGTPTSHVSIPTTHTVGGVTYPVTEN